VSPRLAACGKMQAEKQLAIERRQSRSRLSSQAPGGGSRLWNGSELGLNRRRLVRRLVRATRGFSPRIGFSRWIGINGSSAVTNRSGDFRFTQNRHLRRYEYIGAREKKRGS
jgi:hypothetical protein